MASSIIGALRVNLGLDSAAFGKGLKGAETRLQKFGGAVKKGLKVGAVAVAGAATAVGVAVKGTIDAADKMSKASQKFGVPIEELSRLKHAADLSDLSFESMGTGLRRLSQNMNDAKNGVGESVKIFDQLGISVTDAEGNMKSTSAILAEVSDKFAAMPDGAEKTALAMDLMGRSGADMIPLLNGGAEALRDTMAAADDFGQVFTQEMGSQAENFNDNMSDLKGSFANIAAGITKDLLPHLERFSEWLVENAPAIQEFVVNTIGGMVEGFVFVAEKIKAAHAAFETIGKIFDALPAVISIKIAEIKASVTQLAADIIDAFKALPGKMLEMGGQIIQGLWDGLKSKFSGVKDSITGFASSISGWFESPLKIQSPSKVMHGIGVNIMQGLSNGISSGVGEVGSLVQSIGQSIQGTFSKMVDGLINGTLNIREAISGLLADLGKLLINHAFTALLGGMGGGAGGGLGSLFAGLFANGGTIPRGQFGIVGENGPELAFGPQQIVPMGEMVASDDGGRGGGSGEPRADRFKIVNAIDGPSFLSEALSSPAGERVILNHVRANSGAFKQALG